MTPTGKPHKTLKDVTAAYEASPAGAQRLAGLKKTLDHVAKRRDVQIAVPDTGSVIRFAMCGDRHHGNLCCDVSAIRAFYAEIARLGITTILDSGDVLDGHGVFRGQEFELKDVGLDAQLRAFDKETPRIEGVVTHFITGNHDASFTKKVGVSVGDRIADLRPDWSFMGADVASIEVRNLSGAKVNVRQIHPDGGSSYAVSYRPQKIVEQLEGGSKPDILGIGHYHKAEILPQYRNVYCVSTGTFERQTPFMARNGLAAHVGGWIIEFARGKGTNRVKAEFISFF